MSADWPTFITYCGIWFSLVLMSIRLGRIEGRQRAMKAAVDGKLSYIAVIITQALVEGRRPEEIAALMKALGERVESDVEFAKIAEQVKPSWRRRIFGG